MARLEVRADYYKITAEDGDNGLFGEKLKEICASLDPEEREMSFGTSSLNIDIIKREDEEEFVGGIIHQNRNTVPSKRRKGTTATTPVELETDEGIDETSYFIYCPATSLIAVAYNYHGPKIGLIVHMVNKLYKDIDKTAKRNGYKVIQRGDALAKVIEKNEIRGVTARMVDPSDAEQSIEDLDLPDAFKEFERPKDTTIEVTVKSKIRGGVAMKIDEFRRLFLRKDTDIDYYDVLKVEVTDDQTGRMKEYDLIKDKLQDYFTVNLKDGTNDIDADNLMQLLENLSRRVRDHYSY